MKKKRLLIVRYNPITFPAGKAEAMRKQLIKQLKSGVLMIDKSCTIECYDYDSKQVEIKVIDENADLVVEPKEK